MLDGASELTRTELYKLLADGGRLKVLALCAQEELNVGELCELLNDSQPQVSRRASPLRSAALLSTRKEGTRTWLKTPATSDAVLADAIAEGRRLCLEDGSLARLPLVLAAREEAGRAFFDESDDDPSPRVLDEPVLAHLFALAPLLGHRHLAVDVGTGEGALLDVLGPLYDRVIAIDRSPARLARAARRIRDRALVNVRLHEGSFDDVSVVQQTDAAGGADLVFASRVLHHLSKPEAALSSFSRLLRSGGHVVLLDYAPHHDETMRGQGDVWLGFDEHELRRLLQGAGLEVIGAAPVPSLFRSDGPDAHLPWQAVVGQKR